MQSFMNLSIQIVGQNLSSRTTFCHNETRTMTQNVKTLPVVGNKLAFTHFCRWLVLLKWHDSVYIISLVQFKVTSYPSPPQHQHCPLNVVKIVEVVLLTDGYRIPNLFQVGWCSKCSFIIENLLLSSFLFGNRLGLIPTDVSVLISTAVSHLDQKDGNKVFPCWSEQIGCHFLISNREPLLEFDPLSLLLLRAGSCCRLGLYVCAWMFVLMEYLGANTREEAHRAEASSADSVTRLSGLMTDPSGLPDVDVFGLPIPWLSLEFQEVLSWLFFCCCFSRFFSLNPLHSFS